MHTSFPARLALLAPALLLLVAGLALPPEGEGLYAVGIETESRQYLGSYYRPGVEAEGRWLYADNGRGTIVRWSLDRLTAPRAVFASAASGLHGYLWSPVPAPAGGRVVVAANTVRGDEWGGYQRTSLYVLTPDGQRERGPIPLYGAQEATNPRQSFDWSPDGEWLALSITEEAQRPVGVYIYSLYTNNWLALPGPTGIPRFSPDGQRLAVQHETGVTLHHGPQWTDPQTLKVPGQNGFAPLAWVDGQRLIAGESSDGDDQWRTFRLDGQPDDGAWPRAAEWSTHGWLERSPAGWAWFGHGPGMMTGAYMSEDLTLDERLVLEAELDYAAGLAWDPSGDRLFVGVGH